MTEEAASLDKCCEALSGLAVRKGLFPSEVGDWPAPQPLQAEEPHQPTEPQLDRTCHAAVYLVKLIKGTRYDHKHQTLAPFDITNFEVLPV